MKDSKTALYVTGGLFLLMGLWGLAAVMGWVGAMSGIAETWWLALVEVVVGGWAVWVATQQS